jgi:hypothetical protein
VGAQGNRERQVELFVLEACQRPGPSTQIRTDVPSTYLTQFNLTSPCLRNQKRPRLNAQRSAQNLTRQVISVIIDFYFHYEGEHYQARWPSGLRRQTKDLVSSGAWVRIPLSSLPFYEKFFSHYTWHSILEQFYGIIHSCSQVIVR